jgi:glycerol-3-phosphate acyltransferase PlsY
MDEVTFKFFFQIILILCLIFLFSGIAWGPFLVWMMGYKKDPGSFGSGSPGTTNMLRIYGKTMAIMTLFLDGMKGFLPVYVFQHSSGFEHISLFALFAAVSGSIFSFMRYLQNQRGGKGIAAFLGGLIALSSYATLFFILSFLGVFFISRYASLASLTSVSVSLIFWNLLPGHSSPYIDGAVSFLLAGLIFWAHRENIKRLWNRKELPIFFSSL